MSIGDYAFNWCPGLTTIIVEAGNTQYDSRDNCNAIIETSSNTLIIGCKNTIIPNSVTSIGDWAFNQCSGLTSVTIPNSVTSIGEQAFNGCSTLKKITIGSEVTSIGANAFAICPNMVDVYCYAERYPDVQRSAFENSYIDYVTLHVPAESVNQYKNHEVWGRFKEVVPLTEQETDIEKVALKRHDSSAVIYNLNGQRFNMPRKGLNIINGRKVMMK